MSVPRSRRVATPPEDRNVPNWSDHSLLSRKTVLVSIL
jgi:hypothetical protein